MSESTVTIPIYIDEIFKDLLEKFGKGSHKPGSGSAAALSGMVSAKLLLTVISLTLDPKRPKKYAKNKELLSEIRDDIDDIIFPKLCDLFQRDCVVFHDVVTKRTLRDDADDQLERCIIETTIDHKMNEAIAAPLEIANLCIQLTNYSIQVFDLGWRAVRGDSGVAIEQALAAIGGSTFVINLNLLHVSSITKASIDARKELLKIEQEYAMLKKELELRHNTLRLELEEKVKVEKAMGSIRDDISMDRLPDANYIQDIVRKVQLGLWEESELADDSRVEETLEVFDPKKVLSLLGYKVAFSSKLGQHYPTSGYKDVAGVCDNQKKVVGVSSIYPDEVQRFTLAHELGHALMHQEDMLFRDLPLDGSDQRERRDFKEIQANKFAAFFLMPRKMVISEFKKRFQRSSISLAYYKASVSIPKDEPISLHQVSRDLASLDSKDTNNSMAQLFRVSTEAMAIRLENLKLVVE